MRSDDILRTFAAVSEGAREERRDVVGPRPFVWASYAALGFFENLLDKPKITVVDHTHQRAYNDMKEMARHHKGEELIRLGWIWFSGTVEVDGELQRYCFPALSVPLHRPEHSWRRNGLAQVTPVIEDLAVRESLLARASYGSGRLVERIDPFVEKRVLPIGIEVLAELPELMTWCRDVSVAAGLHVQETYPQHGLPPDRRRFESGIALHVGAALYLAEPADRSSQALHLERMSHLRDYRGELRINGTAFSHMYGDSEPQTTPARNLISFRPLSTNQRKVVKRVSGNDLSVISGAPGTGKTHVLSVIAGDAIARGESVLLAAGSANAVDVLVDHFKKMPGPPPLTFGGVVHGQRIAEEVAEMEDFIALGDLGDIPTTGAEDYDARFRAVRLHLFAMEERMKLQHDPGHEQEMRQRLKEAKRLRNLQKLLARAKQARRESRYYERYWREVEQKLGNPAEAESTLLRLLAQRRVLDDDLAELDFDEQFDSLARTEASAAEIGGRQLTEHWIATTGSNERLLLRRLSRILATGVDAATAQSGVDVEREQSDVAAGPPQPDIKTIQQSLAGLQNKGLTRAAPLWIGSVGDIDSVLPLFPGLFDLVILDEAAQIGQMEAATTLARAKRAVICGDPKQIGHRSYLSRDAFEKAAFGQGTDADLLNPQSRSTFDVAAAQVPVEVLDEHFRSAPHLIGFSSRNFYDNGLHIATRKPANEAADHIHLSVIDGSRDPKKPNFDEVREAVASVATFVEAGWRSIGLVTPFRAQADALTKAIGQQYSPEQIEEYGIRVGTVHQYQGDEREIVIISFAIGSDEPDSAWNFVNQPDLFNVMVTRAREHVVVISSNPSPPGLAGNYLRWSDPLTNLLPDEELLDPWIQKVATALRERGVSARVGYRVGRYVVDIVAGKGEAAVAIDCRPSPHGNEAHVDRAMLVRRAGWRTADAYESRWAEEPERFALELLVTYPDLE